MVALDYCGDAVVLRRAFRLLDPPPSPHRAQLWTMLHSGDKYVYIIYIYIYIYISHLI
jgi:hypothetical protein